MPLLYDRTERDGQIHIRVKTAWYLLRYALIALVVVFFALEGAREDPTVGALFGVALLSIVGVRLVGFWAARKELVTAMRTGSLEVSGSAWSFRHPLRYAFRAQPPEAKVVTLGKK